MKAQIFKCKTEGGCPIISGQESVISNGMTAYVIANHFITTCIKRDCN